MYVCMHRWSGHGCKVLVGGHADCSFEGRIQHLAQSGVGVGLIAIGNRRMNGQ